MTAEEQKRMDTLEAENAALKERLLIAQRTLARYAQMLFGQKTERTRLPEKPVELTGNLFAQEMDPEEQARLDKGREGCHRAGQAYPRGGSCAQGAQAY